METHHPLLRATPRGTRQASYSRWVAHAIGMARTGDRKVISLFESSVPEPRALIRDAIAATIEPDFDRTYVSSFAGGNRYVIDGLAAHYGVAPQQVLCTPGATASLALLFRTFTQPGDHVVIETPGFDLFHDLAADRHVAVSTIRRHTPDYRIDVADVAAAITSRTRMIILSNLHNPSGMALAPDTLAALADLAQQRGVLLVMDEVYGDYQPDFVPAATQFPMAVSVSSLTKFYGLSTLRCGWIVAAPSIMQSIRAVSGRLEFGLSNLSQAVAARVIETPAAFAAATHAVLDEARLVIDRWFKDMRAENLVDGDLPDHGCICFPRLVGIDDTEAFADQLVADHGIIIAPGEYFGAPGHVRLGFGLPVAALTEALGKLTAALRHSAESRQSQSDGQYRAPAMTP